MTIETRLDRNQLSRVVELAGECLTAELLEHEFPGITQEHIRYLFACLAEHIRYCQNLSECTPSVRHIHGAKKAVVSLYCDGASRGNPGPAGAAALLVDENGEVIVELSRFLDIATNNQAEYQALISGLEVAEQIGVKRLQIYSDSELVVKQLLGEYRVRHPRLRPLFKEALSRLQHFDEYAIVHVARECNQHADRLAGEAIDRALRGGERVTHRWAQRE
jgi:ribonuclease HI